MEITSAWLTLNRQCNLSCNWCYAKEFINSNLQMDIFLATKLVDISIQAGVQCFYLLGGEPTLYRDLFCLVSYIAERQCDIVIVTNGILLAKDEFLKNILTLPLEKIHFGISLKGSSEEDYINNCGKHEFATVLRAIENCNKNGIDYSLSYVLSADNIDKLDEFTRQISILKRPIDFSICHATIMQNGSIEKNTSNPMKIEKIFSKKYDSTVKTLQSGFTLHQTFPLCLCNQNVLGKMLKMGQVLTSCHVHDRSGIIFDVDGSLLLCNQLAGFPFGHFGSDYWDYQSLSSFWVSPQVIGLYKKFTSMPTEKCKNCDLSIYCGGGCCVQWFSSDFDSYEKYIE